MSHEATELLLYIENDGDLYRRQTVPIMKNLTKKWDKGTYNHTLAKKLWGYLAESGAKAYCRDHCGPGDKWNNIFSVSCRKEVARDLADSWLAELEAGNRHD